MSGLFLLQSIKRGEQLIQMLAEGLERHRADANRIFQFDVFEGLYFIERAAFAYLLERREEALELYIAGFTKIATEPGYGSARYEAHKRHLFSVIQSLNNSILERTWCERFIAAWQETVVDKEKNKTLANLHPDLVDWCQLHKETLFLVD